MSTTVRCDCCDENLGQGESSVTLQIAGPGEPSGPTVLGDYCIKCSNKLVRLIELVEELLRPD